MLNGRQIRTLDALMTNSGEIVKNGLSDSRRENARGYCQGMAQVLEMIGYRVEWTDGKAHIVEDRKEEPQTVNSTPQDTGIEEKYHWKQDRRRWERVDRVQEYRGHKIETVSWHYDGEYSESHRDYKLTTPSGQVSCWHINKRGGNIKALKEWVDYNIDHNRTEYL